MVVIVIATFVSSCKTTKQYTDKLREEEHLTPKVLDSIQWCNGLVTTTTVTGLVLTLKKLTSNDNPILNDGSLVLGSSERNSTKPVPLFTKCKLKRYNLKSKMYEMEFGNTKFRGDTIRLIFGPDSTLSNQTGSWEPNGGYTLYVINEVLTEKFKTDMYVRPIDGQKTYKIKSGKNYYQVTKGCLETKLFLYVDKGNKSKPDPATDKTVSGQQRSTTR